LKVDGKIAIIQPLKAVEESGLHDRLAEADTCALIEKLMAQALRVFAEYGVGGKAALISGVGKSAEDFAYEALISYLTDSKFKNKGIPYLLTALRNDIIDALRSDQHRKTEHMPVGPPVGLDPENTKCLDGISSPEARADDRVCDKDYEERVRAAVVGESELREVVEAVLDLGELTPAGIAEVLSIPATEVYVRKKRLKRRLISSGIREVPLEK